jgi:hypothetical protein
MGKLKVAALIIILVLIAPAGVLATSWTPWYIVSSSPADPTTPPGGAGWTAWQSGDNLVVNDQQYFWIGAQNVFQPDFTKTGTLFFSYYFTGGALPDYQNEVAGSGNFTWFDWHINSYGTNYEEAIINFVIFPQPEWEWFQFQNIPEPGWPPGTLTITAITIDTTCVPLPGALLLLGSGLLGLTGWRRVRKS